MKTNKVSIIGCGKVGMTCAYSMLHRGNINEIVLFGRNKEGLIGEELDLEHGLSFLSHTKIIATANYDDIANSDVVVISAGDAQLPGETRLDLTRKNIVIMDDIIPNIVKVAPEAVIVMVTNPVDVLTYHAYKIAGLPKGQIFGTGTTLDTARFRFHLSQFLDINPTSIHTYILGEHGDNSFPVISSATVGGQSLTSLNNYSETKMQKAYEKAKNAAYKIIESKGATFYAIGAVVSHIVSTILQDRRSILPVSIPLHNYHGVSGVALSVPCVIGKNGVTESLEVHLDWQEKQQLIKAGEVLKTYL